MSWHASRTTSSCHRALSSSRRSGLVGKAEGATAGCAAGPLTDIYVRTASLWPDGNRLKPAGSKDLPLYHAVSSCRLGDVGWSCQQRWSVPAARQPGGLRKRRRASSTSKLLLDHYINSLQSLSSCLVSDPPTPCRVSRLSCRRSMSPSQCKNSGSCRADTALPRYDRFPSQ